MFELPDRAPIPTLSRYKPQPKLKVYRPSVPELLQTHPTRRAVSQRNETRLSRSWCLVWVYSGPFGCIGEVVQPRTRVPCRRGEASRARQSRISAAIYGRQQRHGSFRRASHLSALPPVHRLALASAPMESGRYALSGSPSPTSNGPAVGERGRAQGAEAEFRVSDTLAYYEG